MSAWGRLRAMPFRHELVLVALLAALLAGAWWCQPRFVALETQIDLSTHLWERALPAVPLTLIVISAGIDLSVGATMALSAVVMGLAFQSGLSAWAAAGVAVAVGTAAGAMNGVFVAALRAHPLIVTLATMCVYRGVAAGLSGGRGVSGFPEGFSAVGRGAVLGVPIPAVVFAGLAVGASVVLWRTAAGRKLYVIGHNEQAARLLGVGVDRIKLLVYTLSGVVAAVAAVLFVARTDTAGPAVGENLELDATAAVVLGGTSIFGGRGRVAGTVLGVLLIHEVRQLVSWRWNRDELSLIAVGALLVLGVLLGNLLSRRSR